jgi:mannitol-1-phosphate/altronate dehydrogenase
VITEPFRQWVIEDRFCADRPPLERVGVQFVDDVAPYKLIKSRLLNGSHSALGYLGWLAGYETSAEAMGDERIARFIEQLMREEVVPGLPADVAGMELDPYVDVLLDRLASSAIADSLARLCRRGSTKMNDYVLPSLHDASAAGRPRRLLALVVAAWVRYLQGTHLDGTRFEIVDPRLEELQPLAEKGAAELLGVRDLFGDLGDDARFVSEVEHFVSVLDDGGVAGAIDDALATG